MSSFGITSPTLLAICSPIRISVCWSWSPTCGRWPGGRRGLRARLLWHRGRGIRRAEGDSPVWGIQLPLWQLLPKTGEWTVWITARERARKARTTRLLCASGSTSRCTAQDPRSRGPGWAIPRIPLAGALGVRQAPLDVDRPAQLRRDRSAVYRQDLCGQAGTLVSFHH